MGVAKTLTESTRLNIAGQIAVADGATADAVHVLVDHGVAVVRPLRPAEHAATEVLFADVHLHSRGTVPSGPLALKLALLRHVIGSPSLSVQMVVPSP